MRVISTCDVCGVEVRYLSRTTIGGPKQADPPVCSNGHPIFPPNPETPEPEFRVALIFGGEAPGSAVSTETGGGIRVSLFRMDKGPVKVADPGDGQW